jgi:uncharacterized repeat protein (TIGR02059 family)
MVAQALRFIQFGWNAANLAPRPSNNPSVNGAALTIPFTGPALVAGATTPSQWSATVNGAAVGVTSATASAASVAVVLATPVVNGQTVRIRYAGGGAAPLKEVGGNLTPPFNLQVNNATP